MQRYFVLDERGEPISELNEEAWAQWFENTNRSIARTIVTPEVVVLTEFTGVDENYEISKRPYLFRTRVFGGVLNGEEILHYDRPGALAEHRQQVDWCRIGSIFDFGLTEKDIE